MNRGQIKRKKDDEGSHFLKINQIFIFYLYTVMVYLKALAQTTKQQILKFNKLKKGSSHVRVFK